MPLEAFSTSTLLMGLSVLFVIDIIGISMQSHLMVEPEPIYVSAMISVRSKHCYMIGQTGGCFSEGLMPLAAAVSS